MPRKERVKLIRAIAKERSSKVLTYICGDRIPVPAQISEDAIRPLIECLDVAIQNKPVDKIDLFLYSRGGQVEVPWKIIAKLRERCKTLGVLVPYKAHSAATMIAIGADEVVLSKDAELGPIDPALKRRISQGGVLMDEDIRVEDVMSFVDFLSEKVGLEDQQSIADNIKVMAEQLPPWVLGSLYRTHSHIRLVAQRLLASHNKPLDKKAANKIIEELAEKIFFHNHAISRMEVETLGLPITKPSDSLEKLMWKLLGEYEVALKMRDPIDVNAVLPDDKDDIKMPVCIAMIESIPMTWACSGDFHIIRSRNAPESVNASFSFNINLPEGIGEDAIPQEIVEQLQQQLKQNIPAIVAEQTRKQSPVTGTTGTHRNLAWRDVTESGI